MLAWGGAVPARLAAEETLSPQVRKAIRLLLDSAPERRAEGERAIRNMGKAVVPQLRAWISRSEVDLHRVRTLLEEVGGEDAAMDEPLLAARPYLSHATALAWAAFHAGKHADAKRTAEAVLRLDPESPEIWQLRRLIRFCDERLISRELLEPTVEFARLIYGFDEDPRIIFRLVNRSRALVNVRVERGILGMLAVNHRLRFIDGSERTDERTVTIRAGDSDEKIALEPGGSFEREIAVPFDRPAAREMSNVVLRMRVVGKFQPSQWGVEDKNLSRTLSLPAAECWLVAPDQKDLADAPIKKLELALILRDLNSYFVGGQLAVWASEDDPLLNDKLLRLLVESLDELDDIGIRVADTLLESASGLARDRKLTTSVAVADHWRRWWAERGGRGKDGGLSIPKPEALRSR